MRSARPRITTAFMAAVCLSAVTVSVASSPWTRSVIDRPVTEPATVSAGLDKLPVRFEPNVGQADPAVAFLGRFGPKASSLFLKPGESVLSVGDERLSMSLVGSDANPAMEGLEPMASVSNYYKGSDSAAWQTGVPNYAKVASRNVYPGIDLVWYGVGDTLEYDLVVAPGVDPNQIRLDFTGASSSTVDDSGNLHLALAGGGEVTQQRPVLYQLIDGNRSPVAGAYDLSGTTVGFRLGNYDPSLPLVIDPVVYSTTTNGGSATQDDIARDVRVDSSGNIYVVGDTDGSALPQVNPQDVDDPSTDVVVYKLAADGTTLIYSTYLASSNANNFSADLDNGRAITIDAAGNAYITGRAGGDDFPTTPGSIAPARQYSTVLNGVTGSTTSGSDQFVATSAVFQSNDLYKELVAPGVPANNRIFAVTGGGTTVTLSDIATATASGLDFTVRARTDDVFVTKLSPLGSIQPGDGGYSTTLGNPYFPATGKGIAVDTSGNAHVGGEGSHPLTGSDDQFVTKVNPTGTGLLYDVIFGGSSTDRGKDVALDAAGNAYVVGLSFSTNFPVTVDAFDSTRDGVCGCDATITRFSTSGVITYASYLGGSGNENASNNDLGIAVDASGKVYVAGGTTSTDFPAGTSPGFQPIYGGGSSDAFVAKLDLSLAPASQLLWSTYLGGSNTDFAPNVTVDGAGNVYVPGQTRSVDFPLASPVQGILGPTRDGFVTKLNASGSGLVWSTLMGGNYTSDFASAVAVDNLGAAYVVGRTASTNFVHPPGQPSPGISGVDDLFAVKLTPAAAYRPADFNADGRTDLSTFRPSENVWYTKTAAGETGTYWGATGDVAVAGDYDGDGVADLATFRPSENVWYVKTATGESGTYWGATNDIPVPADYDGDGKTDLATFRPSENVWYVKTATTEFATYWGATNDIPVPADYNGDGKIDLATFRPSENVWYVKTAVGETGTYWGATGDIPVPGDYDNDGRADLATFRPSENVWYVKTATAETGTYWGAGGDIPAPGDFNADGKTDLATFRPSENVWYVKTATAETGTYWGASGDRPVVLPDAIRRVFF